MTRTCEHCAHWTAGLCCRFPPAPVVFPVTLQSDARADFFFPETKPDDHCGEWSPKPPELTIERRDA
jgi:hypothetical protein